MGKLVQLLSHPSELRAVLQYKFFRKPVYENDAKYKSEELAYCYYMLGCTSRSFAAVIRELEPELRDVVMIFYLVLRALDTVEDDMTLQPNFKVSLLREFHHKLKLKEWSFDGSGPNEKDRIVLVHFNSILSIYHSLKPKYQDIIRDITEKMGNGMADYVLDEDFNMNGVATVKDYDLYCHYVAGLVGEGLSKLMVEANFADISLTQDGFAKSESMGLFLQKTNIIRDYEEDLRDGRSFWPKEVWSKYTDSLSSFREDKSPESEKKGLECINELVLNALHHVKDCLTYLSLVSDPSCFNFCAIPQVMAIATLALVHNNPKVLRQNVKIRKGTTCNLILKSRTFPGVVQIFRSYVRDIHHNSSVSDPNYLKIGIICGEIEQFCELMFPSKGAIPAGVKKEPHPINLNIAKRAPIDNAISKTIKAEELKCNLTIASAVTLLGAILFYIRRS
ncbi:Piso0_002102 [Millerozyma farinosa CBS 7064]|uniref:Squalene synthase n=1 Tax=Pichia sorbitophila (strain ATCC MYA-4447 / BCRC 22081 / CBS 7064 / NBRC 10061 / NRRL Y-12695) TaxID=559304 RepID=G8YE47_PICSO|nr:Piso0_002102 [Millerozyma farinosa CBS 7064]